MRKTVVIPVPKEFIGKWCIATVYGTHGSYHVISEDGMVFNSKSHAKTYLKYNVIKGEEDSGYYSVMQIDKTYPVWQTEMFICGMTEKELIKSYKK